MGVPKSLKAQMAVASAERAEKQRTPSAVSLMPVRSPNDGRGQHNVTNPPSSDHMAKVRQFRKLWNSKMPTLACANCAFSAQCPQFRSGYECAFSPFLNGHKIETADDLMFYAKELLQQNLRRGQQAMLMETLSGASPSLELSESLNATFMQLMSLHQRMTEGGNSDNSFGGKNPLVIQLFGDVRTLLRDTAACRSNPIEVLSTEGATVGDTDGALPGFTKRLARDLAISAQAGNVALTSPSPQQVGPIP